MNTKIYCYFIEDETERINYYITDDSDELQQIMKKDMLGLGNTYHFYECYGKIYNEDLPKLEILKLFRKDFNQWTDECKSLYPEHYFKHFNPKDYYTNTTMILCFFKKFASKSLKKYNIEKVESKESLYQESCYKAGIIHLSDFGEFICYGYDFSGFYQNILGNQNVNFRIPANKTDKKLYSFKFPIKSGYERKFHSFEEIYKIYQSNSKKTYFEKLPYGYYKIKIQSSHRNIKKVFAFSDKHCYTHISLIFAIQFKTKFEFTFELDTNSEFNSYLYAEKNLITSSNLFGDWFYELEQFKQAFPTNKLIKFIGSSLWGRLCAYNREFITIDDLARRNDEIDSCMSKGNKKFYVKEFHSENSIEILNRDSMYKNDLARMKAFLLSFTRDYVSRTIIQEKIADDVLRIHTDGIVLTKPHDFTLQYKPIAEKKTTGTIFWKSTNFYYHKCKNCLDSYYQCSKVKVCPDCNTNLLE